MLWMSQKSHKRNMGNQNSSKEWQRRLNYLFFTALRENRGPSSFMNDEDSKMYKNFLSKWGKYFQEEESRKRQEVAAMMTLRNNIRQHND